MVKHHDIRIEREFFNQICLNIKTFEIRRNDRDFSVGDSVKLKEFHDERETGAFLIIVITYITDYEQKDGYVVFGFIRASCAEEVVMK